MLRYNRDFRAELGTRSSVPAICIFGYGLKTITKATIEREAGGLCRKLDLEVTPAGDGTIPEESAVLESGPPIPRLDLRRQRRQDAVKSRTDEARAISCRIKNS